MRKNEMTALLRCLLLKYYEGVTTVKEEQQIATLLDEAGIELPSDVEEMAGAFRALRSLSQSHGSDDDDMAAKVSEFIDTLDTDGHNDTPDGRSATSRPAKSAAKRLRIFAALAGGAAAAVLLALCWPGHGGNDEPVNHDNTKKQTILIASRAEHPVRHEAAPDTVIPAPSLTPPRVHAPKAKHMRELPDTTLDSSTQEGCEDLERMLASVGSQLTMSKFMLEETADMDAKQTQILKTITSYE